MLSRLGTALPEGNGAAYAEAALGLLQTYAGLLTRAPQGVPTLLTVALGSPSETGSGITTRPPVALRAEQETILAAPGGAPATAVFVLSVAPGFHVNGHEPANADLIPTVATFATAAPAAVGPVQYPPAQPWRDPEGVSLPAYQGEVRFTLPVSVPAEARRGRYTLALRVRVQPCSESACLAPTDLVAEVILLIA